jgi:hypothetical protein
MTPDPKAPAEMFMAHRDGVPWYDAKPHGRFRRHQTQTRAFAYGKWVERCSCGAFGPTPWMLLDKPRRPE